MSTHYFGLENGMKVAILSEELQWVQDLDKLICTRTGGHLSSVDVRGNTVLWFTSGLTPEQAFHAWVQFHYSKELL